jgi:hypothetical protein
VRDQNFNAGDEKRYEGKERDPVRDSHEK